MIKKIRNEERQVLINKYQQQGLSEAEAERKVNSHIGRMIFSTLTLMT